MQRRRSLGIRLLAVFATAGLTAFAAYTYASIRDVGNPHCERAQKEQPADGGVLDFEWARDVVDCDRLDGLTKREVKARLGTPTRRREAEPGGVTWHFPAGGSLAMRHELLVEFDASGKVVDTSTIDIEMEPFS